ncbi:MAG: type II toxin-antitoxin system RelE/ParE family toxin [Phycisphaerales bacterium]
MSEVRVTAEAEAQLLALPFAIRSRWAGILARLERWPDVSGAKPLRGALAGHFRLRTGDYRIQFRVAGGQVIVEKIGHRDGFYE